MLFCSTGGAGHRIQWEQWGKPPNSPSVVGEQLSKDERKRSSRHKRWTRIQWTHTPLDFFPRMDDFSDREKQIIELILNDPDPNCATARAGKRWSSWSEWVEEHLHLTQELFDSMRRRGLTQKQALDLAVKWVTDSGLEAWEVQQKGVEGGVFKATVQPHGAGPARMFEIQVGEDSPTGTPMLDDSQAKEVYRLVEREILICHPQSPVMVITYQEQVDQDDLDVERTRKLQWISAECLYDTPARGRDALMEQDTYESDWLREDKAAPENAGEWEGMFWCRGELFQAGPAIQANREALRMNDTLPHPKTQKRRAARM